MPCSRMTTGKGVVAVIGSGYLSQIPPLMARRVKLDTDATGTDLNGF